MTTPGPVALVEVEGEEPLAHADLRGGEADALLEVHGVVHAVDEGDEVAVDLLDVARALLQHGITEEAQRVHAPRLPARNFGTGRRTSTSDPAGIDVDPQAALGAGGVDPRCRQRVAEQLRPTAPGAARRCPSGDRPEDGDARLGDGVRTQRRPPRRRRAPPPAPRRAGSRAPDAAGSRRRRPASGSPWRAACTTSWSGSRVCRRRRPSVLRSGVPQQPGAADEQPERLLGGPGPRREELLVELQVRDQTRRASPATRCSTASVPMRTGTSGTSSVAASTDATSVRGSSAARSSRTRVIPGRTARNVRAVAVEAHLRTRASRTARSGTPPPVARPSRRTPRSAPARWQVRHGEQTRPAAPVEHADARAHRGRRCGAARRRAPRSSSPCPGSSSRWSTTSTRGHARRRRRRRSARPIATTASTVGAGVSTRTAAPHACRAFERDVARVPRGRALVFQRFVALVEHDDRARDRAPVPTPRCGRRSPRTRRHAPAPSARCARASECSDPSVTTSRPSSSHSAASSGGTCRPTGSITSVDPSGASGTSGTSPRGATTRELASRERRARDTPRSRPRPGRRRSRRLGGDAARRKRRERVRPSATRPSDRGRPRRRGGPADETASTSRRSVASGCATSASTHPAAHPPAVQRHAHDGAHLDGRGRAWPGGGSRTRGGSPGRRAGPGRTLRREIRRPS